MLWGAFRSILCVLIVCGTPVYSVSPEPWTSGHKLRAREATRQLWQHGFYSYMHHAFPLDELKPLTCGGQGPDWKDPTAIHFNDVNANVSLTLLDNLDSFVVLSNRTGFEHSVRNVIDHVTFDVDTKPQVFEITIRALGGLLSGHLFASEPKYGFRIDWYNGELLRLAQDLGARLLPAFDTPTGIPYARVNLRTGIRPNESPESCTAGAGSLLLEFATLSRWTGDMRFEIAAKRAFYAVWNRRTPIGLVGNGINVKSGAWTDPINGGIGAGIDSFYEYALKMYILTGEEEYLDVWNEAYGPVMKHSRGSDGFWYQTIGAFSGDMSQHHVDSLGAFWPGLQVLAGDLDNAIKTHLAYWQLWKRFSGIPESFNILTRQPITLGYPLRPEFIESTYFLYRATRDSFYLDVGERILEDLTRRAKVPCGLATISNLLNDSHENRMESFALSESLKYLFLLFDEDNFLHTDNSPFVFTTEAHMLALGNARSGVHLTHFTNQTIPSPSFSPFIIPPLSAHIVQSKPKPAFDQMICPAYVPVIIGSTHRQLSSSDVDEAPRSSGGLRGSIRDRDDYEYARVLAGISVTPERALGMGFPESPFPGATSADSVKSLAIVTDGDRSWWRADGWCEVPKAEPYVLDWVVSPSGGFVVEDRTPSPEKLAQVDGGFVVRNISGLHIQVTARIDRSGYEITKVGPHPVTRGQKVYISDPEVTSPGQGVKSPSAAKLFADGSSVDPSPDIYLRFGLASEGDSPSSSSMNALTGLVVDVVAATATFGGNPAFPRIPQTPPTTTKPRINGIPPVNKPLLFGPESPYNGNIRVIRAEPHNTEGCDDHHPGLRFGYTPTIDELRGQSESVQDPNSDSERPQLTASPASVLWIQRGSCTFLRKIVAAKQAGFNGVIVWNAAEDVDPSTTLGGLVNPSIDDTENAYAERELSDVAIVLIGHDDGKRVEDFLFNSLSLNPDTNRNVVVEVFVKPPPPPPGFDDDDDIDWDLLNEELGIKESDLLETRPPEDLKRSPNEEEVAPRILYINGLAIRNAILL